MRTLTDLELTAVAAGTDRRDVGIGYATCAAAAAAFAETRSPATFANMTVMCWQAEKTADDWSQTEEGRRAARDAEQAAEQDAPCGWNDNTGGPADCSGGSYGGGDDDGGDGGD
jgi:hypothetical protein